MVRKIVAITACSAGIAHTYLAADALLALEDGEKLKVRVETQGSIGVKNELTTEEIAEADIVIIGSAIEIDLSRFAGKRIYKTSPKEVMKDASSVVNLALDKAEIWGGKGTTVGNVTLGKTAENGFIQHIMSGISYMVPMVISAGLLLAVANIFAFQKDDLGRFVKWGFDQSDPMGDFMYHLFLVGKVGFTLMIPLFAGFVANSIASRPAIVPAMIGAYIANDAGFLGTETGGGFLSAILVAFIVGYLVKYLKMVKWPKILEPLVPIMILPILSTLVIMIIVKYAIGGPIAIGMSNMYDGLTWLSEHYSASTFIIGAIIGAMIGFDFGGPINKTALIFGTAVFTDTVAKYGIEGANFIPQTAAQAAISVAPLGIFVASKLFKNKFTQTEQISANSAFGMGIVGVTEGAIPFAAANPVQMISASVTGSALAGGLVGLFNVKFYGGIGSPIGTFVGYIEQPIPFITWIGCTFAGIFTTAMIIGLWRSPVNKAMPLDNLTSTTGSEQSLLFQNKHITTDHGSKTKNEALGFIAKHAYKLGYVSNKKKFLDALIAREKTGSTGYLDTIATPHAKHRCVLEPAILVTHFENPIEWETEDGLPVKTAICLVIPEDCEQGKLMQMINITRKVNDSKFRHIITSNDDKQVEAELIKTLNLGV